MDCLVDGPVMDDVSRSPSLDKVVLWSMRVAVRAVLNHVPRLRYSRCSPVM